MSWPNPKADRVVPRRVAHNEGLLVERLGLIQDQIDSLLEAEERYNSPLWEWLVKYLRREKNRIALERLPLDPKDIVNNAYTAGQAHECDVLMGRMADLQRDLGKLRTEYAQIQKRRARIKKKKST